MRSYIWSNGEIIEYDWSTPFPSVHRNNLVIDTTEYEDILRYGKMTVINELQVEGGNYPGGWTHVPWDQFPLDFKMALMLLGVDR